MRDITEYLDRLIRETGAAPGRITRVPLRGLLHGFGYRRRHPEAMAFIRGALRGRGLRVDLPSPAPALEDEVVISLASDTEDAIPVRPAPPDQVTSPATGLRAMAQRAVAATVEIRIDDSVGAGVIVHPEGLVVTARHVVADGGRCHRAVAVRFARGRRRKANGFVFRAHHPLDFALLWLDGSGPFPWLTLGNPAALQYADTVLAVGHPETLRFSVSKGIVSNPRAVMEGIEYIQTDAALDHGNSGGPLLNESGEVVGINSWELGTLDCGKFALPVDYMAEDISAALELGRSRCLASPFCVACGHLQVAAPRRFCPVCGARELVRGTRLGR